MIVNGKLVSMGEVEFRDGFEWRLDLVEGLDGVMFGVWVEGDGFEEIDVSECEEEGVMNMDVVRMLDGLFEDKEGGE